LSDDFFDPTIFTTEGWKTYTESSEHALSQIRKTHRALPLPLFHRSNCNLNNKGPGSIDDWHLIDPSSYETALEDALVIVNFRLVLYEIDKADQWSAYVTHIRKLKNTINRSVWMNPSKRRHRDIDDLAGFKNSKFKK
jgi:hypothetical protein